MARLTKAERERLIRENEELKAKIAEQENTRARAEAEAEAKREAEQQKVQEEMKAKSAEKKPVVVGVLGHGKSTLIQSSPVLDGAIERFASRQAQYQAEMNRLARAAENHNEGFAQAIAKSGRLRGRY